MQLAILVLLTESLPPADYPSDMIDTDSSDDEEMTIKDYEKHADYSFD